MKEYIIDITKPSPHTGKVFDIESLNRLHIQINERIHSHACICDFDNNKRETNISQVCTSVTKCYIEDTKLVIEYDILDTPAGEKLKKLAAEKIKFRHMLCYEADVEDGNKLKNVKFYRFTVVVN